jgi:hypothetical protein
MCNEYYMRRRREEDESRAIWQDFERAEPFAEREPPADVTEPEPTEPREAVATPER